MTCIRFVAGCANLRDLIGATAIKKKDECWRVIYYNATHYYNCITFIYNSLNHYSFQIQVITDTKLLSVYNHISYFHNKLQIHPQERSAES